jgi:murein L,D-transpeptidase YcbB/YkuD
LALALLLAGTGCKSKHKGASGGESLLPIPDATADKLQAIVASSQLVGMRWPNYSDYQQPVQAFYAARGYSLAWVEDHHPTGAASAFIREFQAADRLGLLPEDYDASQWPARVQGLAAKSDDADATFDAEMTIAVMRLLSNVHRGRINPTHFNFEIDTASKALDLPQLLDQKALEASDVDGLVRSLEPDSDDFRKTEQALATYLDLARQQEATPRLATPLPDVDAPVKPGGSYAAMPQLLARLQFESSFALPTDPADAGAPVSTLYTRTAAGAVKTYQETHGLTPDGRLTSATINSLNVPMSFRVRQLDDALERWRWLPEPYIKPALMVNLPEFLLRGYSNDPATGRQLDFTMKVVVGKAEGGHDTPVFTHMMRYLIFRPFWNVPMSIIKKELTPHIDKSGIGYLAAKNFETVNSKGQHVEASAAEVERGGVIVREKPGPGNSLGLIKFMFPNQYDVYLHSTPQPSLFNRTRRDFSHGCVRVQKPGDLAVWVLRNQAGDWDLDKVQEAMQTGPDNREVSLKEPIPVVIFYLTAHIDEQGRVNFFDDIYGYDREMDELLAHGMPYPGNAVKINPNTTPGDTT